MLDLFQLGGRTVYVVEHRVRAGDGLDGRLLAEVAEGYAVVPVLRAHTEGGRERTQRGSSAGPPSRLAPGDRVVLLGPGASLQRMARAAIEPGRATLRIDGLRPFATALDVATVLAQQLALSLEGAQAQLAILPATLDRRLHAHQAHRLRAALEHAGAIVSTDEPPARAAAPPLA